MGIAMEAVEANKEKVEELYRQGLSLRKVAELLQLKSHYVWVYIKQTGLSRNNFNGIGNPFYGKIHTAETRFKISKSKQGKPGHNKGKSKYPPSKYFNGALIHKWQKNAKARNIEWHLSYSELDKLWERQNGRCALTGRELIPLSRATKMVIASLDRIDSNKSYTVDNVQLVTGMINIMKNILNNEEFIVLCKEVSYVHG